MRCPAKTPEAITDTPPVKRYAVVRRVPQLFGDPEFVVSRDSIPAEAIALFFKPEDAHEYVRMLYQSVPKVNTKTL